MILGGLFTKDPADGCEMVNNNPTEVWILEPCSPSVGVSRLTAAPPNRSWSVCAGLSAVVCLPQPCINAVSSLCWLTAAVSYLQREAGEREEDEGGHREREGADRAREAGPDAEALPVWGEDQEGGERWGLEWGVGGWGLLVASGDVLSTGSKAETGGICGKMTCRRVS